MTAKTTFIHVPGREYTGNTSKGGEGQDGEGGAGWSSSSLTMSNFPHPESLAVNDFLWICEGSDSLWFCLFSPLPKERPGGVGTSWAPPWLWSPVVIILIELGTQ